MAIALYVPRSVKLQSFKGVKELTVPNQSMSLKEILQRFIRRESLPLAKEGVYNDQLGDLEKMATEDITIQMDRVNDLRSKIKAANVRMKAKQDADLKAALDERLREQQAAAAQAATVQTAAQAAKT